MCLGCAHVSCACARARARARGGEGGGSLEDHNIRWARWHAAGRGLPRRACIAHEMASGGNRGRPIGRCKYIQLSQVRTRTERHCRDKEVKIVIQTGNLDVKSTRWVKSKISFTPCVKSGAANRTIGRRTSSLLTAIFTAILHSPHLSPYKTIRFGKSGDGGSHRLRCAGSPAGRSVHLFILASARCSALRHPGKLHMICCASHPSKFPSNRSGLYSGPVMREEISCDDMAGLLAA